MTPQQRFDIVVYRMDSAKRLLVEIEKQHTKYNKIVILQKIQGTNLHPAYSYS